MKNRTVYILLAFSVMSACFMSPPAAAKDVGTSYHKQPVVKEASPVGGWDQVPMIYICSEAFDCPVITLGPVGVAVALLPVRVTIEKTSMAVAGRTIRQRELSFFSYSKCNKPAGVIKRIVHVDPGLRGC